MPNRAYRPYSHSSTRSERLDYRRLGKHSVCIRRRNYRRSKPDSRHGFAQCLYFAQPFRAHSCDPARRNIAKKFFLGHRRFSCTGIRQSYLFQTIYGSRRYRPRFRADDLEHRRSPAQPTYDRSLATNDRPCRLFQIREKRIRENLHTRPSRCHHHRLGYFAIGSEKHRGSRNRTNHCINLKSKGNKRGGNVIPAPFVYLRILNSILTKKRPASHDASRSFTNDKCRQLKSYFTTTFPLIKLLPSIRII